MVDMIVDQRTLGIGDGLFDGMQLLCDFSARATFIYHRNDSRQMTIRSL